MIGTPNAIAVDDLAHMQGRESVRTAILQRSNISVRFSEKNDRLFQNRTVEQLTVGEVIGPGGDIPCVAEIGAADHFLFAVEKLELRGTRHRGSSRPLGRGKRRKAAMRFLLTEAVVNDPFASAGTKPLAER